MFGLVFVWCLFLLRTKSKQKTLGHQPQNTELKGTCLLASVAKNVCPNLSGSDLERMIEPAEIIEKTRSAQYSRGYRRMSFWRERLTERGGIDSHHPHHHSSLQVHYQPIQISRRKEAGDVNHQVRRPIGEAFEAAVRRQPHREIPIEDLPRDIV